MAETPKPFFDKLVADLSTDLDCDMETIAASLAYMLQKDRPLEATPEPKHKPRQDRDPRKSRDNDRGDRNRDPRSRDSRDSRPNRDSRDRDSKPAQPRESKRRTARDPNVAMQQYRLEVGREHAVTPGDIVGAIANEADIDSSYIGGINIQDDYSTVELPDGMPKEILDHLKKVRVRNHPMNISVAGETAPSHDSPKPKRKPKPNKD